MKIIGFILCLFAIGVTGCATTHPVHDYLVKPAKCVVVAPPVIITFPTIVLTAALMFSERGEERLEDFFNGNGNTGHFWRIDADTGKYQCVIYDTITAPLLIGGIILILDIYAVEWAME